MKRKYGLLALSCAFMLVISSCGMQGVKGVQSSVTGDGLIKRIKIISNASNVRQGCSADSPVLQSSAKDSKLDVLAKIENWYGVKLTDGRIGFVPQNEGTPVITGQKQPTGTGTQQGGAPGGTGQQIPNNTNNNSTGLTADEQQMLTLVNQARAQNNLPALKIDTQLENMARLKSQDMINNNYFSHNSPTYGDPFTMMKNFGIEFVKAGENIAGNQTVKNAHESLMNSPGHRANILSPDYTHVGIGIKKGGPYGMMFTQDFISRPQ